MRINEITRLEGKKLYEALDSDNDTGAKTEDLVKIVEAHRKGEWKTFDTAESFESYLDELEAKARAE
jgi:hypothetical protein